MDEMDGVVIVPDAHCLFPREGMYEAGRKLVGQFLGEIEMCQNDPKVQKSMVVCIQQDHLAKEDGRKITVMFSTMLRD
jgi:hypothetical protein